VETIRVEILRRALCVTPKSPIEIQKSLIDTQQKLAKKVEEETIRAEILKRA